MLPLLLVASTWTDMFNYLFAGNLFWAVITAFTLVLGSWFYIILIGFLSVIAAVRSQTIAIPAIISATFMLTLGSVLSLPQEAYTIAGVICTIFFGLALFNLWLSRMETYQG